MEDQAIHRPSRVVLAVETRLLREIIGRAIAKSPFLQVVGEVSSGTDLHTMVEQTGAEWVFASLLPTGKLPEAAERLLAAQPSVSIIAVTPDGSQVKMVWTEPHEKVIARTRSGDPMKLRWTESHQKFLKDLSLGELISVLQKGVLWELAIHDYEGITDLERRLSGKRIAVLVADGFEQAELAGPMQALRDTGAEADIVSPANNSARGRCFDEWGDEFRVDVALQSANVEDYDGLLLPGGITNSDALRTNKDAVRFVKAFYNRDKPIAALCYGVRILIEARVAQGHRLSSCKELKTDLEHAGAKWINEPVVVDDGLVTGRRPDDIPLFNRKMIEMFACA